MVVPDYQLSLAIGKEGQNVRLAARLCGWKIDIKSHSQYFPEGTPDIDTDDPIFEYVVREEPEEDEIYDEAAYGDAAEAQDAEAMDAEEAAEAGAEEPAEISVSAVKRMKKAELIEFAKTLGIELDPKATNAAMIEEIVAAMEG